MKLSNKTLILFSGPIGAGKSTFGKKWFDIPVLNPDFYRGLVSGDEGNQNASRAAFDIVMKVAEERMKFHQPVVIDALNQKQSARNKFYDMAKKYNYDKVVIVFDVPLETCQQQNRSRNRVVDSAIVELKHKEFKDNLGQLKLEDIHDIIAHDKVTEKFTFEEAAETSLNNVYKDVRRLILFGDIHSCHVELKELIQQLKEKGFDPFTDHTIKFCFVGDLCDRGDKAVDTLDYICNLINSGVAFSVLGNHDNKLLRYFKGNKIKLSNGLEQTVFELNGPTSSEKLRNKIYKTLETLPYHLIFDDGKLVVSHAGLKDDMIGKNNGYITNFCIFGDVTGQKDEFGFPIRRDWAKERLVTDSSPTIVYGHTPNKEVYSINKCHNIDTGVCFGHKLTAMIYDAGEVSFFNVKAKKEYWHYENVEKFL